LPRNASGVYSPPSGTLAVTGTTISSTAYNNFVNDVASAITGSLPRNGSSGMQANLAMGGFKISGLGAGTAAGDALRFEQFFPSGTVMMFAQSSAPSGWTKQTSAIYSDAALRFTTGAVSQGGTVDFSTLFGRTATDSHALDATEMPAHSHTGTTSTGGSHTHGFSVDTSEGGNGMDHSDGSTSVAGSNGDQDDTFDGTTGSGGGHSHSLTIDNTGGGGGHTHDLDLRVKFADVIAAAKD
jgi:hypothetical protein